MSFRSALRQGSRRVPLMFEPVPPPKGTSRAKVEAHLAALRSALASIGRVDVVNVPQIIGGAFETIEARDYALAVQASTGVEAAVNKVVALDPEVRLASWLRSARADGLAHFILVGGESSKVDYPGPSVADANTLAQDIVPDATVGNICIPFRRRRGKDEPQRMVEKTRAGAHYFTSQIVQEPVTTRRLLRDYDRACRLAGVAPATVFIGLAPVTDQRDLELLKNLGVEVPPHVERDLLWDPDEIGERSTQLNLGILRNVLDALRAENVQVPVGLNVEQVSLRNWDASVELAREASFLLEEHAWMLEETPGVPRAARPVAR